MSTVLEAHATDAERPQKAPRAPAPEIRPGETREKVALASSAMAMVGITAGWFLLQLLYLGGVSEVRAQHLLYQQFRTAVASGTAAVGPTAKPGEPVAELSIPTLGEQLVVVEGADSAELRNGPGHRSDTVLPGQAGVSVVYGRAQTYGGPFAHLATLRQGDQVFAQTGEGRVELRVLDVRRAGDPLPPAPTGTQARVTLVSSEGRGFLGGLRADSVVYVDAVADKGLDAPGGLVAAPASEHPMAADPTALALLVLCLAALAAAALAVAVFRQRFPAVLVWTIATPVAIALAWMTTDVAVRLLPNLL